jgi:hypothetical protein
VPFFTRTVHRQDSDPLTQSLFSGVRCAADAAPGQSGAALPGATQPVALTPAVLPTVNPNITPSPLPSLPPGG